MACRLLIFVREFSSALCYENGNNINNNNNVSRVQYNYIKQISYVFAKSIEKSQDEINQLDKIIKQN